jgi:hypothetical protein
VERVRVGEGVCEGEREMESVREVVGEPELERERDVVALSDREVEVVAERHRVEVGETVKEGEGVCEGEVLPVWVERAEGDTTCARRRGGSGRGGRGGRGARGVMGARSEDPTSIIPRSDVAVSSCAAGRGGACWPSKMVPCTSAVAVRARAASAHKRCRAVPMAHAQKEAARRMK